MAHDSRTAPKFVVRYASPDQRDAVAAAAEEKHIAINSFICQAIDEKLARAGYVNGLTPEQSAALDALVNALSK